MSAPLLEAQTTGTLAGLPAGHFIDGRFVASASGATMETLDPGTGCAFARFAAGDADDVDAAVAAARRALVGPWARIAPAERGRLLRRVGELITANAERLAVVESLDSGKRISEARGDVAGAARTFEFYAGACDKIHGETLPYLAGYTVLTLREPHGVTGHIVPWNYPMQIVGRSVGAALAMGNACVLKPAEEACLSALALPMASAAPTLRPMICIG